jgi:hypothetical protein
MRPHLLLLAAVCTPTLAQNDGVVRCQALTEPAARLACYDGLFPPRAAPTSSPVPPPVARATAAAPAATPAAPPASAPSAPPSEAVAQFGLPQKAKPTEIETIESAVAANFTGWGPNDRIRLLNGQVWEVVDGSSGTITPDMRRVKVRRGLFGAFFLDFEGLTKSPKVRRLQ